MGLAIVATLANFFLPGLGWIILREKVLLGVAWLIGVIGITFVETSLQTAAPDLYLPMFASVFLMNTAFAVDVWKAARARAAASAPVVATGA